MTRPEFEEWLGYHFALFRSCETNWYQKMSREQKKAALHAWHKVLEHVELDDAKKASEYLLGQPKKEYATHDQWPGRVKERAAYMREERLADESNRKSRKLNEEHEAKREAQREKRLKEYREEKAKTSETIGGVEHKDGVPF